jgi:hypothetical protein
MTTFAATYEEARAAFRLAAQRAGARLEAATIPGEGVDGEALTIDWALIGPEGAAKTLLSISGTHGAEGHAGSVAQRAFLDVLDQETVDGGCNILMVHALNPWGLSHGHRVNADNVDLSRNFCDFGQPRPDNPLYERIHAAVCPDLWREGMLDRAQELYDALAAEAGHRAALTGFTGGQYVQDDGLAFGGRGPSPSHLVLRRIVESELAHCRQLALLEWHTGAGAYGEPLIMALQPADDPARRRMDDWWAGQAVQGPEQAFESGETPDWAGLLFHGLQRWLPDTEITGAPIEVGTVSSVQAFEAVMIDRWLRLGSGPADARLRDTVRSRLRAAYDPPDPAWRAGVARVGEALHRDAWRGLLRW